MRAHLDEPTPTTKIDPLAFFVRGWLWLEERQAEIVAIECWSGDALIGETRARYLRPDVSKALALPADAATGFELFAHHPAAGGGSFPIHVTVRLQDGARTPPLASATVQGIHRDYRTNHFGVLLDQGTTAIQRHDNIFAVGPPQAEGSGELAALIRRYLGPPPKRIIDVGCGLGSYGRGLLADGYDWMGAEVNTADCAELARLGLPHRHIDGRTLPFAPESFDAALCIEVLEHIAEPRPFLAEIKRVAPSQLIVSVPNCELLGYLYDHLATPWHMLEATHTNFFTRWSLGALLREFYPHVELRFHTPYPLRTVEGTPLHYNLLAIATKLFMTHEEKIAKWIPSGKVGTEIGAGVWPLPGFNPPPIYVDCFKTFGAKPCRGDYFGHACRLPFQDHALDYVATSHVLEHVANPVAALAEWHRVLRPGGIIYLVVPHRHASWDHTRALTTVEHMLEDFERGTTACDATHIDEFVFEMDWSRYIPTTPLADVPARRADLARGMHEAVARGEEINIHFHTFEASNLRELIETLKTWPACPLRWDVLDFAERFPTTNPNGILMVLRVRKSWHAVAETHAARLRAGGDPRAILREDAEPFDAWAQRTAGMGGRDRRRPAMNGAGITRSPGSTELAEVLPVLERKWERFPGAVRLTALLREAPRPDVA